MPRRRPKGCLLVLLVILGVSLGRARPTPDRKPAGEDTVASTPEVPAARTPKPKVAPARPAGERPSSALPDNKLTVKVVGVHDGDTITVLTDGREQIKVRLDAIDAPELGQAYGQASKKALSELVFGKQVTIVTKKHDRYGRTIGHVIVDGGDVNLLTRADAVANAETDRDECGGHRSPRDHPSRPA